MAFDPWLLIDPLPLLAAALLLGSAAWRLAALDPVAAADAGGRLVRATILGVVIVVLSVLFLGAVGWLGRWPLLALALLAYGLAPRHERSGRVAPLGTGSSARAAGWLLALLVVAEVWSALPVPPTNWDAMTYHLYFAARWVQEGAIFHIPTVFSDPNAAYAPQNGALIFAWMLALAEHDALCNVVQVLLLVPMTVSAFRIVRRLGLARTESAAAWGCLPLLLLPTLRRWAGTANVDVFLAVFFVLALDLATEIALERRKGAAVGGRLCLCGLAAGVAAGTKVVGLSAAFLPLAVAAGARALCRLRTNGSTPAGRRVASLAADLGLLGGASLVGGGWWYLHNLLRYGNPVFPLDVGMPGVHFRGMYTAETLRTAPFHVELPRWLETVAGLAGPAAITLCLSGLAGLVVVSVLAVLPSPDGSRGGSTAPLLTAVLVAFVPLWTFYEYAVIPFNNQVRFLNPAFLVAALGWPWVLERLPARLRAPATLAGVAWLWWTPVARGVWLWRFDALRSALPWAAVGLALALLLAALGAAVLRARARRRRDGSPAAAWIVAVVAAWGLASLATWAAETSRVAFLVREDYRISSAGWLLFHAPDLEPLDVAYAGANVPYALMGRDFRHRVLYVQTRGEQGDSLYDFWRDDPRLYQIRLPSPHRGDDDPELWLRRLEEEGIDVVALFAMPDLGFGDLGPAHGPRDGAFPLERGWIRRHPQRFERLVHTPQAEVYRVVPPAGSAR